MTTATQAAVICRLFVPMLPVPRCVDPRDERSLAWVRWLRGLRKFAVMHRVKAMQRPCRVEATVRMWESDARPTLGDAALRRWRAGLLDVLARSLVPHNALLCGITVRYEALPPGTPLLDRPRLEGTEIAFLEAE